MLINATEVNKMKGKKGQGLIVALVVIMAVAVVALIGSQTSWFGLRTTTATIEELELKELEKQVSVMNCPDDGDTSLKIDFKNTANESTSEAYDNEGYLYKVIDGSEEYVQSLADTTSPTAATIDCGFDYVFKPVSSSGTGGNSSFIQSVLSGEDDVEIKDGFLHFTAESSNENIIVGADKHATLQCRLYDNNQRAFVYNSVGASGTDYETDGVTFTSTTDNATAMDESLGLNLQLQCKAVETNTNYNDRGVLILIEAPTATWSNPSVKYNGIKLSNIKSTGLTDDEVLAYANYEYVFLIPASVGIYDAGDGVDIDWNMDLAGGVASASADPEIDLVPRGSALSIDGVNVLVGTGVKDDASHTTIHVLYDATIDVT